MRKTRDKLAMRPGKALAHIREHAGYRQADLGALLDWEQPKISALERGRRLLRFDTFALAAAACGYSVALVPDDSSADMLFIETQQAPRRRKRAQRSG